MSPTREEAFLETLNGPGVDSVEGGKARAREAPWVKRSLERGLGARVTVMVDRFFGLHQDVVRSGLWARMKPGEKDLYVFLMEQSERYCTRKLTRTDAEIQQAVGVSPRCLCNSRKRLGEFGLIQYRRGQGNRYEYIVCDPLTRAPYPGDPRAPVICRKRPDRTVGRDTPVETQPDATHDAARKQHPREKDLPLEAHGIPGIFDK